MLRIMVLSIFTLSECVSIGYEYKKPIVPFELLNNQPILQDFGGRTVQESIQSGQKTSYPVPYGDYFHSKLYVNNESGNNVIQSTGSTINSEHQNPKISTLQDLTSLTPITTELNANIEASLSVQSSVVHSPIISESKSIYEPTYSLTSQKTVPLINLLSTESQRLNSENVHNVDSNLLSLSNNIPLAFDIENSNSNLLSIQNDATSALNPRDHLASNVQDNMFPTLNQQNVLPLFNVQHSDRINVQYNEQSLNASNGLIGNTPPIQEVSPKLYTSSYNTQNSFSDNHLNEKRNNFYSNLHQEKPQLFESQNNPALDYQSQFDNIHSNENQIEIKQNSPTPVVTKHVYFHVPPPDIEEVPVVQDRPSPKKIYKIIFITLPEHESKNKELQASFYNKSNQVAYNEDKTIIYVLVNNTEPAQLVLPQPKLSEHEVLFVKYRDNSTTPEKESPFIKSNSDDSDLTVTLGAGLVNGN